ncbi:hypothetical protein H2200_001812 [Cladophialophora chaetospira]|uniref:Uncharacterized protein n=1 Tax=Cladophialophora chaetospira TaxID=386627 RepID=A0AA38XLW4_9EURO|nr:hypothetical protein H2200_001812 [Cladophialophora chaetospira]
MATRKKTIIVGSLYDFTDTGSNELIQTAKEAHQDPETAPFFYIDASKQTFCAEVDQDDNQTLQEFLARMAGYIDCQQSTQFALDDELRLRPKAGTTMEDLIPEDVVDDQALLKYSSDSDSDGDALETMQHLTAYWKPKCGNINILTPMYAKEITRLTGSSLFAEEAEKRYRIFQGNFQLALEKLLRVEPLLETFDTQSPNSSMRAAGNILVWPSNQQNSKIAYANIVSDHPSIHRVIVNRQEQALSKKVLAELRSSDTRDRLMVVPDNLQYVGLEATVGCQASKIWDSKQYPSFGSSESMVPIVSSTSTPAGNSKASLLGDVGNDRITRWTNTIVPSANPNIAPEVPVEPVAPARRRVKVDSDSEDDEPIRPVKAASSNDVPTITQASTSAFQFFDDADLIEDDEEPIPASAAASLPLRNGHSNTLLDISEEGEEEAEMAAKKPFMRGTQSLSTVMEHDMDILATMQPTGATSTKQLFDYSVADAPETEGPPLETEVLTSNTAPPAVNAGSKEELRHSPPTVEDVLPTTPGTGSGFVRPTFDPNAYRSSPQPGRGQRGRGGRGRGQGNNRGQANNRGRGGHRGGRNQNDNRAENQQRSPAPLQASAPGDQRGRGRAGTRGIPPIGRSSRGGDNRAFSHQHSHGGLIDVEPATTRATPAVPPGFESIVPLVPDTLSQPPPTFPGTSEAPTTVDTPEILPENSWLTSTPSRPRLQSNARTHSTNSITSRASTMRWSNEGWEYMQTSPIPKVNQAALREQSLQSAMAAVAAEEALAAEAALPGNNQLAVEEGPPRFHSTMRQQAGNPGRGSSRSSSKKKETKDEAAARRQRVLEDAYGPTPMAAPPPPLQQHSASPKLEEMSKWKKSQMKRQTPMAEAHPEIVSNDLRDQETSKLVALLRPVFETGRAFKGKLVFEIQIGQVLITPGQQVRDKLYHEIDDWTSTFNTLSGQTFSTFTKILTTNGADIDRALESKVGEAKLWSSAPSFQTTTYEFQCQSRSNEDFQIIVHERGNYELRKGQVNIGAINIHIPAQIWDLSATLSGPLEWSDVSDVVAQSAREFVESIYILPERKRLILYFRPPTNREIKIQTLIVKRTSYHSSNRGDGQQLFLKVTEAKNLQFRVHPDDHKLWVAHEANPKNDDEYKFQLADNGRIHYEMSIVHSGISDILVKNESLELGELTATASKSILDRRLVRPLLDSAIELVSKIDYIGMWNYGTQRRLYDEEQARQAKLIADLGPRARTMAPPSAAMIQGSNTGVGRMQTMSGSTMGGETVMQPLPVPGVRMNTEAEIMVDEAGQYLYGMGGSRVPLPETPEQEVLNSIASVLPDDSASNAGKDIRYVGGAYGERGSAFW